MVKRISLLTLAIALGTGLTFSSCAQSQDYKTTEGGLEYKYIEKGKGLVAPELGDVAELNVIFRIGDSVIVNTLEMNNGQPVPQMIQEPMFPGDLTEGMMLMREGDQMTFRMLADSMSAKTGQPLPPFAKSGDYFSWDVTMLSLKSQEQMEKDMAEQAAKQIKIDDEVLQAYFKKNNINPKKTESGIYYVIHKEGKGQHPEAGQKVSVNYTGTKMNGEKFDSSVDPAFNHVEPLQFNLGQGQVIKGWDEGLTLLKRGSEATLYIPSSLAYGAQSQGAIGPNEILIFDVELIDFN